MDDNIERAKEQVQEVRARISHKVKRDLKNLFAITKEEARMNGIKNLIKKIVEVESNCFDEPMFDEEDLVSFEKPKMSNYYKMCQAEMLAMNNHKFEGTSITCLDVLKWSIMDEPICYAIGNHIVKELETKNYETLYPIYASKLRESFHKVIADSSPEAAREQAKNDGIFKIWKEKMKNSNILQRYYMLKQHLQKILEEKEEYEMLERNLPTLIKLLTRDLGDVDVCCFSNPFFIEEKPVLSNRQKISNYYTKCQAELTGLENHMFEGTSVTYFALLLKPVDVLARYVRNDQLVKEFATKHYETLYPIYGSKLKLKFNKALARRQLIEKASAVLSETLQFAGPDHVAFEIILQYLSKEDIDIIVSSV